MRKNKKIDAWKKKDPWKAENLLLKIRTARDNMQYYQKIIEKHQKALATIQEICSHQNFHKSGQEMDTLKHLYTCDDCDFEGYHADFH